MSELDLNALMLEQRQSWEVGTPIRVEDLLTQHPALQIDKESLLDVLNHEIVLRSEFGPPPTRDEYIVRFPQLQDDLELLFNVHDVIEEDPASASTLDLTIYSAADRG